MVMRLFRARITQRSPWWTRQRPRFATLDISRILQVYVRMSMLWRCSAPSDDQLHSLDIVAATIADASILKGLLDRLIAQCQDEKSVSGSSTLRNVRFVGMLTHRSCEYTIDECDHDVQYFARTPNAG